MPVSGCVSTSPGPRTWSFPSAIPWRRAIAGQAFSKWFLSSPRLGSSALDCLLPWSFSSLSWEIGPTTLLMFYPGSRSSGPKRTRIKRWGGGGGYIRVQDPPQVRFTLAGIGFQADYRLLDISKIHVGPAVELKRLRFTPLDLSSDQSSVALVIWTCPMAVIVKHDGTLRTTWDDWRQSPTSACGRGQIPPRGLQSLALQKIPAGGQCRGRTRHRAFSGQRGPGRFWRWTLVNNHLDACCRWLTGWSDCVWVAGSRRKIHWSEAWNQSYETWPDPCLSWVVAKHNRRPHFDRADRR